MRYVYPRVALQVASRPNQGSRGGGAMLGVPNQRRCTGVLATSENIKKKNIEGIIVGKAIYDGDIDLKQLARFLDA